MRKTVLSVVTSCVLVAFVPASALAHGHHHKRHHRGQHARVHHRTFGQDWSQSGANTSPSTSSDENAGTVQKFENGVLTIQLNDGTLVSGKVTDATEIECQAPDTSSGMQSHESGDDNGGGDDQGDDNGVDDENENEATNCDSSALTAPTIVHEASLKISSAGATWDKIELVTASAANNNNNNDNDNDDD